MNKDLLIVDDSSVARMIVKSVIREEGLDVAEASSGEEALEALAAGLRPRAVILDLTMPGMGGVEALRRMEAGGLGCPVIVVTADMQRKTLEEIRGLGAAEVLGKPIKKEAILSALSRLGIGGGGK